MTKTVYYLTGINGRLRTGLGEALLSRGVDVTGRELVDDFRNSSFQEQRAYVAQRLCWKFVRQVARLSLTVQNKHSKRARTRSKPFESKDIASDARIWCKVCL